MTKMPACQHCWHPAHRHDCGVDDCGCVRYEPQDVAAREARQRLWVAQVKFLVKNGWTRPCEVRVRAQGHGGALLKAVREAKRQALKPRARVQQVWLNLVPVPRSAA